MSDSPAAFENDGRSPLNGPRRRQVMIRRLVLAIATGVAAAVLTFTIGRGSAVTPASATRPSAIAITTARSATLHEEEPAKRREAPLTITDVRSADPSESPRPVEDDPSKDDGHDADSADYGSNDDAHHQDDDSQHDDEPDDDDPRHDDEDGGSDD